MAGQNIEQLIDETKHNVELTERERQEMEIRERREAALARVAEAAREHLNPEHNEDDAVTLRWLVTAMRRARIAAAEAMADLAERGDFRSEITWWQIRNIQETQVIWKGYTCKSWVYRGRLRISEPGIDDNVDISVRMSTTGAFVAEFYGNREIVVGIAKESPREAVVRAYRAYYEEIYGKDAPYILPDELLDIRDK